MATRNPIRAVLALGSLAVACSYKQGDAGALGASGSASLIRMDSNPGCANGGVALRTGNDLNGNGRLDDSEILYATSVCRGSDGSPDTAPQVLNKLLTVDGAGSGLDADRIRGQLPEELAPPGAVMAFAGAAAPSGWLLCDGREVSRALYPRLFQIISVLYGDGNGTTTFNLPDYRGRFLRGVDGTAGRDPGRDARSAPAPGGNAGNAVGSVQGSGTALPTAPFTTDVTGNHSHVNGPYNRIVIANQQFTINSAVDNVDATGGEINLLYSSPMAVAGAHAHSITAGGDGETRPTNAFVNFIIKY